MADAMKIGDQVTVGPQPSAEDLQQLKEQGFNSIVNVRAQGEEGQPLSPEAEGEKAKTMGLEYLHSECDQPEVEQFIREYLDDCASVR